MDEDQAHLLFTISRLGYGPRAEDFKDLAVLGTKGWLEEQLNPPAGDDPVVADRLGKTLLRIKYDADDKNKIPAMDEMRPLSSLAKGPEDLWGLLDGQKKLPGQEKGRPRMEVIAATMLRSVYSRYQLREVMAQFWHDHFHVNAGDDRISVALPAYDRDVIRKNCLGNFREMLEAVATSTAMLYYLSNHSSRAGAANENYARELFELHSFGRENYLNDRYDRWREVPGALQGQPEGYIDQDVYEAARAFTGWTVEDGSKIDGGRSLPSTGRFTYVENWHDGYQKRVLATEFDPFDKPMADGRKVLDLIANHPATAQHMSKKLCQRLIGPAAPDSIVQQTTELWRNQVHAPDQIAQVVRLIALSPEFAQSRGTKVKRPLALMANYVRIMGFDFTPTEGLFNQLSNAGHRLFGAPTPVGIPDDNAFFLGTNAMRNRWQLLTGLAQNYWGNGVPQPSVTLAQWGRKADNAGVWADLFGGSADEKILAEISVAAGFVPFAPDGGSESEKHHAIASSLTAMNPDFQVI
jgi:uncharacterized protein (DUF1800 family)